MAFTLPPDFSIASFTFFVRYGVIPFIASTEYFPNIRNFAILPHPPFRISKTPASPSRLECLV